jgi:glycosyltransferase involved in cell wall biosynthesis
MKGIFAWPGYRQAIIQFQRDARFCGETKWNYLKLLGLAVDGITSFSIRPLRIATFLGALIAGGAFVFGTYIITKTVLFGDPVTGSFPTMAVQLGLGGIQLLSIGLLGEYIGRIFIEVKRRPLYFVSSIQDKSVQERAKKQPTASHHGAFEQRSSVPMEKRA